MFEKLPSLRGFQPKFYSGGPTRFHLPLLYDLVATEKPKLIVTMGWSDGQAFFTFCQAANEEGVDCQCVAVNRERGGESADDDAAWREGRDYGEEFYGDRARFFSSSAAALAEVEDGSVDLLLLDDCDSGTELRADQADWQDKLSPHGIILLHGVGLEREDNVKAAWQEWLHKRPDAFFQEGLGLAVGRLSDGKSSSSYLLKQLFGRADKGRELAEIYSLASSRIEALGRAAGAEQAMATLEIRQVWLDSLLADRSEVQQIMDHQAREIANLEQRYQLLSDTYAQQLDTYAQELQRFENLRRDRAEAQLVMDSLAERVQQFEALRRDRAKAQLVMDSQHEQLKHWVGESDRLTREIEQLTTQIKDQKRILSAAKKACRNKGRCFHIPTGPKVQRPFGEKILRELSRLPRNLRISRAKSPAAPPEKKPVTVAANASVDRYGAWIADHEADAAALERQLEASKQLQPRTKISLIVPMHNTPGNFLEEMFASVAAQTYDNWELCVVDGGSDRSETIETLRRWEGRDERIRVERLKENLGISENSNRALQMASGELIACLDHDDLLAPSALFEVARAAAEFPEVEIFYSDEDRLSAEGKRHAPFFKPEWSPMLLWNSMYIGHLTAYRRNLALEIGGFRKEFDLSQDYDFALRATERARWIHHIPHVLYHWREHPASGSTGGKPDARRTNLAALEDAMRRRNLPADIIEYPTANRARLKVSPWPRVSVIVPTDSPTRAQACLKELPAATKYPDLEIVLVTNSKLVETLTVLAADNASLRLVPYDKPFNFSDKCNVGAEASTGERLIFFNDDVETGQTDWIQNLIEPLEHPEIGAVSPKLLYESGKIQHAGLVMGVRGLAGTAFHQRPADSTEHFNLAQSLRDVSALSAACLAMRRADFFAVGGFDAVHTPIAHSDIDLCFKVREAGLRCVYTPYATLRHAGHVSIGGEEKQQRAPQRDKASIFLLKRWAGYTTQDPYFPENMRDWLYSDSPTSIRMAGRNEPGASIETSADLLFVSHDLSLSGAPMMLFHAAAWCRRNGIFVVVMAPEDGPLREKFEAEGIPVIIDPLVEMEHESFAAFARHFDCVLANTIRSGAVVRALKKEEVPVVWWLHEPGSVGEHYLREESKLRASMPLPNLLFAPSEQTATVYRPFTESPVKCLRNAIPDVRTTTRREDEATRPLRFLLLASVEPRKGQDIFVKALAQLPKEIQESAHFEIAGRILDPDFWPTVGPVAEGIRNLSVTGALSHAEAIAKLSAADVVVSPSRDEAMPTVTILEAMCLGKAVVTTTVGGALEVFTEGNNALLVRPESPESLAAALRRLIADPTLVKELGETARQTYEENFTIERFGPEFFALINEAISPAEAVVTTSGS